MEVGESQIGRLEKKLSTLSTLCDNPLNFVNLKSLYAKEYTFEEVNLCRRLSSVYSVHTDKKEN